MSVFSFIDWPALTTSDLLPSPAPSEVRSVERMILHYPRPTLPSSPAPSELRSVERMIQTDVLY